MTAIQSMTGFGRSELSTGQFRVCAELRSVNHRYLELSIKMPRRLQPFEARIRELVKTYVARGKTDLFLSLSNDTSGTERILYNEALAAEYMKYAAVIAERFGVVNDLKASTLMRFPDVLTTEEVTETDEELWEAVLPALTEALEAFTESRRKEGERLREDILGKLSRMQEMTEEIEQFSPSVVDSYRARLTERINETLADRGVLADESRIVTEVAIFADKICTDEESVRLKSHIRAMQQKLSDGGPCGRELDFIAQEMNREANTTLSKAAHLRIADTAIALKTEIEKIREQVQNIE